ncbi:MAG: tetratricopeptide repeat protein [Gemmatimonadota bacterium]
MRKLKWLIHEVHRRSLWQVLAIFLGASWAVLEFVAFLTERAGLPDWTPSMALVFLALGLPMVMATAFVQEGLPGGDERDASLPGPDAGSSPAGGPLAGAPASHGSGPHSHQPSAPQPSLIQQLFTWRKALLGGVGALSLVALAAVGYLVMWSTGIGPVGNLVAQGVFEKGESVVLAEFGDPSGTGMGRVVTEALRVDLQESNIIQLAPPTYITAGLARMGLPPDAPFTAQTARELALRDGLKAVIQGEVSSVGSGYLLTASVVATESGDILRAFRVPVAGEDDLLGGIDRLSREIREKSGESLRSIRQGVGLAEATTASLDALRLYTDAVRAFDEGRPMEALPLLEEALERDPEFAMAWRKLAVILSNESIDPDRMRHASIQAYSLRRRLTEREAGLAEAWYLSTVEDNPEGAIDAYRRVLDRYPDDRTALNNTAVRLLVLGRWTESEEPLLRVAARTSRSASGLSNLVQVLWNVGKRDEAWAWQDTLEAQYPEALTARRSRVWLLAGEGKWEDAHDVAEGLWRDSPPGGIYDIMTMTEIAGADLARGRFAEAMGHLDAAKRNAVEFGAWELFWWVPAQQQVWAALALEGPERARQTLRSLDRQAPVDSLARRGPRRVDAAALAAQVGDTDWGRRLFDEWEGAFEASERGRAFRAARERHLALEAWGRGDWSAAVASFERLFREITPCGAMCVQTAEWGIALEEAGRIDEAMEKYRWHLADTQLLWHSFRVAWTPTVLERMARIHASRGEFAEARALDERLVELFGDGDGPFVGFVERANERLGAGMAGGS